MLLKVKGPLVREFLNISIRDDRETQENDCLGKGHTTSRWDVKDVWYVRRVGKGANREGKVKGRTLGQCCRV